MSEVNQYNNDDQREGLWKDYWLNDKLMYEGLYKNGQRVGLWKGYYPNGSLMYEGQYKNDRESGLWKYYNKGKLIEETYYV
jgi:uncharacterized protein